MNLNAGRLVVNFQFLRDALKLPAHIEIVAAETLDVHSAELWLEGAGLPAVRPGSKPPRVLAIVHHEATRYEFREVKP